MAQSKIKNSDYWCEYSDNAYQMNNFINKQIRNRILVKYHRLAYVLVYIKRETLVSTQIGSEDGENKGVNELLMSNQHDDQTQHDVTNDKQDMMVCEDNNQINCTNDFNQGTSNENTAIANVSCSSVIPHINLYMQRQTIIVILDNNMNEDGLRCNVCKKIIICATDEGYVNTYICMCGHAIISIVSLKCGTTLSNRIRIWNAQG